MHNFHRSAFGIAALVVVTSFTTAAYAGGHGRSPHLQHHFETPAQQFAVFHLSVPDEVVLQSEVLHQPAPRLAQPCGMWRVSRMRSSMKGAVSESVL